ncbi:sulfatase-like hydrolase/transferase [Paludicola sp. MB14-C6]|uniref:sulfatase-like hydrolase/transferase n=1 Tax=Paludihabitans sp. MB14-C6 TaxID=3070656 RepID=UPI0027DCD12A|nr:sulfatase-like hydrolase/transferase [Paludicola sp. MB14-C6]WMJ22250.1 sulfatase-like hydrolase/transferase [Paludicola sp. MB14-C6]
MKKPNILFILTDDQRADTIHALGNKQIKTPNLDKLVENGTAFTHAHIPGGTSGAVCMPSRAMINSGKTLYHLYGCGEQIPTKDTTMGQCFKENGYETIGIGKWHSGTESYGRSFCDGDNIFFGGMWDHWNVPVCNYHKDGIYEKTANFTPNFFHANHPMPMICDKISVGQHSTDLFTKSAIEFIEKDREKPFFLYLSYLAPHDPRTMPEEFQNMYNPDEIELPENFAPGHPFYYGVGLMTGESRDEDLASYPRTEKEVKQHIADYYAMISHIDYNVGKLIEALEKKGELDNTIIVFTGDNGLAVGQHGLMGKQSVYDHSVRVPLIISGAGIEKGLRCDNYVYLLDIYPSLCELVGLEIPNSVEGRSFEPMLKGSTEKTREDLYFSYTSLIRSVKNERYKLLEYRLERSQSQLFDLQNDPNEMNNLYHDPNYADVVKALKKRLLEYKAEWEDTANHPFSKKYWDEVTL